MIYLINKQMIFRLLLLVSVFFVADCQSFISKKIENKSDTKSEAAVTSEIPDGVEIETAEKVSKDEEVSVPLHGGKNLVVEKSKNKKGKIITTKYYGAELIREKITENGITFTRISIRGNATIDHEGVLILSPQIILDNGEIGRTVGGVQIIDKKEGLNIRAGSAIYNKQEENVKLLQNPYMVLQKNKNESKTLITTNSMVRDLSDNKTVLDGDVRVFRDSWTVLGDKGTHYDNADEIILEKNPVILDQGRFLTGDNLQYKLKEKQIVLDGRVFSTLKEEKLTGNSITPSDRKSEVMPLEDFARKGGVIPSSKSAAGGIDLSERGGELSILSSDSIVYDYSGKEFPVAQIDGNVLLTQTDFYLKSPSLKTKGKGFETIYTKSGVEMLDRKESIHVTAGEMFYERSKRFMRLDLYPKMEFLKKDSDEIEGTLEAAVIETNFDTKETLARGNVMLTQSQFTATGEIATYKNEEDLIIMEGDPSITQSGGTVSSEKILIYPRSNRVFLKNRIRGSVSEG